MAVLLIAVSAVIFAFSAVTLDYWRVSRWQSVSIPRADHTLSVFVQRESIDSLIVKLS